MSWDYLIDVPGYSEIEEKMSDDYLDLDPKGWEAAKRAFLVTQADYDDPLAAAIRAYEAHKASGEESALTYARRLCILMAERFYPDGSPDWRPLPDLVGILTQIDNMSTGLERAHKASAVPLSWRCQAGVCDHDEHLPAVPVGPLFDARDIPPDRIFDDAPSRASAVPEEIAEVVRVLRAEFPASEVQRAADLLETYARPPSSSKP